MRKSPLLILLVAAGALAAVSMSVQRVLTNAIDGERLAAARYEAFAAQAQTDGYSGVASLFRAQAKAERIHLHRFVAAMEERGLPVPPESTPKIEVASTERNLQAAISAEQAERDSTYLYAINTCNDARDPAIAKLFDMTRDAETEHANLCADALRTLRSMTANKAFYVCPACGYTTDVHLRACPSCSRIGALDRIQ